MPVEVVLFELLVLPLGKFLLKKYFAAPLDDVGGSLLDMVGTQIKADKTKRATADEFNRLSREAVERLVPLFQDYEGKRDVNVDAMIHEIATTLDKKVDADFFVDKALDATALEAELKRHRPLPSHLESANVELYNRGLKATVLALVDIAPKLPHFEARLAAKNLQSLKKITVTLDLVLATAQETKTAVHRLETKVDNALLPLTPLYEYKEKLRTHFRLHENIGLPATSNSDESNVAIELRELFVEPYCSEDYLNPDAFEAALHNGPNPAGPLLPLLAKHPRIVVLGDPGIGKSTLVQWLLVTLAEEFPTNDTPTELQDCIPLPFILRDLSKDLPDDVAQWTWKSLVEAFTKYKPAEESFEPLIQPFLKGGKAELYNLLNSPRALFLLDGLDEIGNHERRVAMRNAIWQGFKAHPEARWIITSRLIGYDSAEVDVEKNYVPNRVPKIGHWGLDGADYSIQRGFDRDILPIPEERLVETRHAARLYLAPFNDAQQLRYATNWYVKRLDEIKGQERAKKFVGEVHLHPSTRVIGRVPNILHLLALLYQHRVQLPNGRFNVYKAISEAYLRSIDYARELEGDKAMMHREVPEKERWLSCIAWQMQRRRTVTREGAEEANILATREEIMSWGVAELQRAKHPQAETEFESFLDFIGRRSGLLIPRGSEQYGFAHLSFLEYYAAHALLAEHSRLLTAQSDSFGWEAPAPTTPEQLTREDFASLAADPLWHEVLTFVAESYSGDEHRTNHLISLLFPLRPSSPADAELPADERKPLLPLPAARLLATLSLNPHVNLTQERRRAIWDKLWAAYLDWPLNPWQIENPWNIAPALLANEENNPQVMDSLVSQVQDRNGIELTLHTCFKLSDISSLASYPNLQAFYLSNASVNDVSPLSDLINLKDITLLNVPVSDLLPLAKLTKLEHITLQHTQVSDVSPLSKLINLQFLNLSFTCVNDVAPLANLNNMKSITLISTSVSDVSPLAKLPNLQKLYLDRGMKGKIKGVELLGNKVQWM